MATEGPRRLRVLIFVLSCSCLVFELSLLRTFSIALWYHFAFMVISIAMLGLGASGTFLSLVPGMRELRHIPLYALLFALSLPLSYIAANAIPFDPAQLAWETAQALWIGVYYLALAVPFFLFGCVMSTAYGSLSGQASSLYASDLLGAGVGSIAVLLLLSLGGPELAVLCASCLAAGAVLLVSRGPLRLLAVAAAAFALALALFRPSFIEPRMSPYKPLSFALSLPGAELTGTWYRPYGRVDSFRSPAVRFAPGLSLGYAAPLPRQTGIAVDGGSIEAVTDGGDRSALRFLEHLPSALTYHLIRNAEVLVQDPGGGLAILTALRHGAARIDAVESNPLLLALLRASAGRSHGAVTYRAGMGRAWLLASGNRYDIIDIPLAGALGSSAFGFAEDHRYTVEAFMTLLEHLAPGGILSITHYIVPPPRTELRTLATLAEAAGRLGMPGIDGRVIALRSWDTVTILFSPRPFDATAVVTARRFCAERRFDLVAYPGMSPGEGNRFIRMQDNSYAAAFRQIIGNGTRERFLADHLFDLRPVSDDRPFPRYHLRLANIRETYRIMGGKWQFFLEEGYLLPAVILQAAALVLLLLIAPLLLRRHSAAPPAGRQAAGWPWYFACLGLAYLFVETALIQSMTLALEHPSYAAGTVIAAVLIGSGAGSLLSEHRPALLRPRTVLFTGMLALLYGSLGGYAVPLLLVLSHPVRIAALFALLLPIGLFMGIPFPLGMTVLGRFRPDRIAWAWAVNGCFSVLAPILAVMIALTAGYRSVLLLGGMLYLSGYAVLRRMMR